MSGLFEIEELDKKRRAVRERLKSIPARRDQLSAEIARHDRSQREKEQSVSTKEKALTSLELDLKTSQTQDADKRIKLNSVKTQKEYDAIKSELDTAVRDRGNLEEKILLLMDEITEMKNLQKRGKATLDTEKKRISEELGAMEADEKALQAELTAMEADSEAKLQALPEETRREYVRLRAILPEGQILSKLVFLDNTYTCSACNSPVSHQIVIDIKRGQSTHRCDICHRMLHP